ncbi:MAG: hypothetical protein AAGE18_08450 [Pseudomonadota bacterium]
MALGTLKLLGRLGAHARRMAALVIAGVWRKNTFAETERRLAALPMRDQVMVTAGVFGALICLSYLFGQFGVTGFLLFLLLVVVVVN